MHNRLVSISVRSNLIYRFDIFLNILNVLIMLIIQIAIWKAVFSADVVFSNDLGLADMIPYAICSSFVGLFVNSNVIERINSRIKSGDISLDLIKPISFDYLMFFESCGMILSNLISQLPVICIFVFVYRSFFAECYFGFFFFISVLESMVLYFLISYCVGLVGFWYLEVWHLRRFVDGVIKIFSGAVIPIAFFPKTLKLIMEWLPLRGLYDIPIQMMIEGSTLSYRLRNILFQFIWIVIFYILKSILYKKGISKVEAQGG